MFPIKLKLEDFCGHELTEINFDDFQSAVIVGKSKGNEKISNGVGKSTIFSSIKYVLFNETDFSALDKIIRHGTDLCRVSFEFKINNEENYKIVRSKSKKGSSDVRLYKQLENDWEDITQRTNTDTEKEISKLIKINYKTFCNSVLFAQKDLFNIAAFTPEKRKLVLKDVLQLGVYSKYEGFVKKKITDLDKEVERNRTTINLLGNPKEDIEKLNEQNKEMQYKIEEKQLILNKIREEKDQENKNKTILEIKCVELEKQSNDFVNSKQKLEEDIESLKENLVEYERKKSSLTKDAKILSTDYSLLQTELSKLKIEEDVDYEKLKVSLLEKQAKLLDKQVEYKTNFSKLEELKTPILIDSECKFCRQKVSEEAKENCKLSIHNEIKEIEQKISLLKEEVISLKNEEKIIKNSISIYEITLKEIEKNKNLSDFKNKELQNKKQLYLEYKDLIEKNNNSLIEKEKSYKEIILNKNLNIIGEIKDHKNELQIFSKKINKLSKEIEEYREEITLLSNSQAVILNKINDKNKDIEKLIEFSNQLIELERKYNLHQKVSQAFSSAGIPALITHTILDDYQIEANEILSQLYPGLQLKFGISKDRSDGEKGDTLEISYLLDGKDLEYAQLSGAQSIIASFALKIGLLSVIKKRLGADIRLLLLDEIDQSLDERSLEIFEDIIKKLQTDFKILVITHNNAVKSKFNNAILVEQDENLVSKGSVVNVW